MATSRLELLAGALVARLVAAEGVRGSRLEDGDGFRVSRLEFAETSWRVFELSAEFRLVSRAVILVGLYNLVSERLDEPRGLVDGVVLVGRPGR